MSDQQKGEKRKARQVWIVTRASAWLGFPAGCARCPSRGVRTVVDRVQGSAQAKEGNPMSVLPEYQHSIDCPASRMTPPGSLWCSCAKPPDQPWGLSENVRIKPPEPKTEAPPTDKPDPPSAWIVRVLQTVAELPDRTSPDDWPEAMLVTHAELQRILEEEDAALRDRAVKAEAERYEARESLKTLDDSHEEDRAAWALDRERIVNENIARINENDALRADLGRVVDETEELVADLAAARAERDAERERCARAACHGCLAGMPVIGQHHHAEGGRGYPSLCYARHCGILSTPDAPKEPSR